LSGLREKNKERKRQIIQRATLDILLEKGFDRATTREIAERAGVAKGTIFLYAHDKVDLCLMCINDDIDKLTDAAFNDLDETLPLLDQVVAFFRPRYEFWARHPELSRAATREMSTAYAPADMSREYSRGIARRAHTHCKLSEILRRGASTRKKRINTDDECLARILLDIYLTELRIWLSADRPRVEKGLSTLRCLMAPVVSIISP
jgi:AcrR family transcriptional regulator